jgi:CBS domain-containing protein
MALVPGDTLGRDETIGADLARMGDRYGIAILVVDEAGPLEGIAPAGDLRKAILRGRVSPRRWSR